MYKVSLASGIIAGFMGALVSHPADTVVTRLGTGGFGRDWRGALANVLADAESDDAAAKARVLYLGVTQRRAALRPSTRDVTCHDMACHDLACHDLT